MNLFYDFDMNCRLDGCLYVYDKGEKFGDF